MLDDALTAVVEGNELMVSVAASQVISNAPASILLSGFSENYFVLALGTDLGGLGTLIASMANLISFKKYTEVKNSSPLTYILGFTLINILFLVPMLIAAAFLLRQTPC
jgi:Na+/H+ antiporter NhaD/arsenite permease-like protein